LSVNDLLRLIRSFNAAATEGKINWQPGLPLELAVVESTETPTAEGASGSADNAPRVAAHPARVRSTGRLGRVAASETSTVSADESTSTEEGLTLKIIQKKWYTIRDVVRKLNGSAEGLLNSCTLLDLRGNRLYLGFTNEVLKSKLEDPERLDAAQKGLEQVLGVPIQIHCVIATDSQSIPPEVDEKGMVAAAVRLGGKIVDSREITARDKTSKTQ
jgi:hypothetical protein